MWEIFHRVLEADAAEREALLEAACADDEDLRREVEDLLATRDGEPDALDRVGEIVEELGEELRGSGETCSRRPPELEPGTVLAGRFEVLRPLGSGGMGALYEARDRELGISVALKLLHPELAGEAQARDRFRREIHLARRVTHANACRIFDLFRYRLPVAGEAGEGEDVLFLTMELLEGETLSERIRRDGPMDPDLARSIATQICDALASAHSVGIIHRDLKSTNIMLQDGEDGVRAVVTDFGIATSLLPEDASRGGTTLTGHVIGTPEYMAPEQLEGGEVSPATDVYSLGLIFCEMLTGDPPDPGESPLQVLVRRIRRPAPSIRGRLRPFGRLWSRIVPRCLEESPRDRFRDAGELAACLRDWKVPWKMLSRHRTFARLAVFSAAFMLVLILIGWLPRGSSLYSQAATPVAMAEDVPLVLIAEFANDTGEPRLGAGMRQAVLREVLSFGSFAPVPRRRLRETLTMMRLPSDARMDSGTALEIGVRDNRIGAIITGRVQRIGDGYSLYAEVLSPRDGSTLATVLEEPLAREDLPEAFRNAAARLGAELRAGKYAPVHPRTPCEEVTATSTEAYRRYVASEEYILSGREDAALESLLDAVRLDPGFAMAHMRLARLRKRHGAEERAWAPDADRAFELRHEVTERERIYIEGAYYEMTGDFPEARSSFLALLALSPDDPRPAEELSYVLPNLSEWSDAALYRARVADVFPDSPVWAARAWRGLAIWRNDPEAAEPYRQRVLELTAGKGAGQGLDPEIATCKPYPIFQTWLRNDVEGLRRAADEAVARARTTEAGPKRDTQLFAAANWYILLGMLDEAERAMNMTERTLAGFPAVELKILYYRGDDEAVRTRLQQWYAPRGDALRVADGFLNANIWPWLSADWTSRDILQLVEAGLTDTGRRLLQAWRDTYGLEDRTGYMAIAAHALRDAGEETTSNMSLEQALKRVQYGGRAAYFLGSEYLARRYERAGELDRALRVLEDAARQRPRAYPRASVFWLQLRAEQARMYRAAGRVEDAIPIEEELRRLLQYAGPDHRVLREMDRIRSTPPGLLISSDGA